MKGVTLIKTAMQDGKVRLRQKKIAQSYIVYLRRLNIEGDWLITMLELDPSVTLLTKLSTTIAVSIT